MGTFYTKCRVENHVDRKKSVEIPKLLVDTGSEFTWIDSGTLKKLGVTREKKDYTFVMANGHHITRPAGFAIIHVGDTFTVDEVVFAEPGDLQLLGARSLEGLNLRVDSRAKKTCCGRTHSGGMRELKVGALRLILFLLILANWPLDATEKPDLSHLKTWVGKYPTDEESKPPKNLFHLPEIQNSLKKLLGKTDYKHLTEELCVETPIQIIRNFLVVKVCYPHCCPCDNAMLVINLDDTAFHAGFYERTDKQKFNTRWFSSTGDHWELPKEVLDIFLQTHETK